MSEPAKSWQLELDALDAVYTALEPLDRGARARVLSAAMHRCIQDPVLNKTKPDSDEKVFVTVPVAPVEKTGES